MRTKLLRKHHANHARVMQFSTAHGEVVTPAFMPVATRAAVNCLTPTELASLGSDIILGGNTYHMLVAPGMPVIQQAGGMHAFMAWNKSMLTDSGGFQVFSLSRNPALCQIDDEAAHFRHPITDKVIKLTPEVSLRTQKTIGADIIMAFDQCTEDTADQSLVVAAMQRTHRWLAQSIDYHLAHPNADYGYPQALFGIIQGSRFRELRERSAEFVVSLPLDGIAIGGETIGFDMPKTAEIIDWVRPILPPEKIHYTMGVGAKPQDIIDVVALGIDIFDCVAPTRNARHGSLYSGKFKESDGWLRFDSDFPNSCLPIKRSEFATDENPIMADCHCQTCQHYCRAQLHYLAKQHAPLFASLACQHNVAVMQQACQRLRAII